jgi:alpha-L-fucosidase
VGGYNRQTPWESCITIGTQWAWKPDDRLKSRETLIRMLVNCVGGDGNLLLNVGPMPDGRIEPRQAERLREVGEWLEVHGESIYGARGGPIKPLFWGVTTSRDNCLYAHVMNWPTEGPVPLPPLPAKVEKARVLGGGELEWTQDKVEGIDLYVPPADRKDPDTVIVLELDRNAENLTPGSRPSHSLAMGNPARASNVYREMTDKYGPQAAVDDDYATRWATGLADDDEPAWLEVSLGGAKEVDEVVVYEALGRTRAWRLEAKVDGEWKTVAEGEKLGTRKVIEFDPVTTDALRLVFTEFTRSPTIWEMHVMEAK